MNKGQLPIVLSSAQQITADIIAVQGVIWIPSAVSHSFQLDDNGNNVLIQASLAAAGVLAPYDFWFPEPIECNGLSLKQISGGDTLLIYPAGV